LRGGEGAQHGVDACLVARAGRLQPADHGRIEPDMDGLLQLRNAEHDGFFPPLWQRPLILVGHTLGFVLRYRVRFGPIRLTFDPLQLIQRTAYQTHFPRRVLRSSSK
jgi:hypothetical protein